MAFIDETYRLLNIAPTLKNSTLCQVSPSHGLLVEGYKKIYELSNTKIMVLCKDGKKLEIIGTDLKIKEISHKELSINGTISTLNFF